MNQEVASTNTEHVGPPSWISSLQNCENQMSVVSKALVYALQFQESKQMKTLMGKCGFMVTVLNVDKELNFLGEI